MEHAEKESKFFQGLIAVENGCIMEEDSECSSGWSSSVSQPKESVLSENERTTLRDSDVALIKQLQVLVLDLVRNYDSYFEL